VERKRKPTIEELQREYERCKRAADLELRLLELKRGTWRDPVMWAVGAAIIAIIFAGAV